MELLCSNCGGPLRLPVTLMPLIHANQQFQMSCPACLQTLVCVAHYDGHSYNMQVYFKREPAEALFWIGRENDRLDFNELRLRARAMNMPLLDWFIERPAEALQILKEAARTGSMLGAAIHLENGLVAVFDVLGQQVPELQGDYNERRALIVERAGPHTIFHNQSGDIVAREDW